MSLPSTSTQYSAFSEALQRGLSPIWFCAAMTTRGSNAVIRPLPIGSALIELLQLFRRSLPSRRDEAFLSQTRFARQLRAAAPLRRSAPRHAESQASPASSRPKETSLSDWLFRWRQYRVPSRDTAETSRD